MNPSGFYVDPQLLRFGSFSSPWIATS